MTRSLACLIPVASLAISFVSPQDRTQVLTFVEAYRDGEVRNGVTLDGLGFSFASAVSPDGRNVYVCSGNNNIYASDPSREDNALAVFARDAQTGRLSFLQALFDEEDFNTPGSVEGLSACRDVLVSPDGRHVYTAAFSDGAIGVFSRNLETGLLNSSGSAAWVPAGQPPLLSGVTDLAFSPDGMTLFAVASIGDSLAAFSRSPSGALSLADSATEGQGGISGLNRPLAVTVSPDGRHVYVVSGSSVNFEGSDALTVYAWDAGAGELAFRQSLFNEVSAAGSESGDFLELSDVAVSPDGRHVYTAASASEFSSGERPATDWLALFTRNPESGRLEFSEAISSFSVCNVLDAGAIAENFIAVSSDGERLYATKASSSALAVFSRSQESGRLGFARARCLFDDETLSLGINLPRKLSLDPEGNHVYVPGNASNALALFETRPPLGELLFPVPALEPGFTGVAFVNRSQSDHAVELDYFPSETAQPASSLQGFDSVRLELESGSQRALLATDLFPGAPTPAWIGLREAESISSFFQFGLSNLTALDGGVASTVPLEEFWISRILEGDDAFQGGPVRTLLSFFNPHAIAVTARFDYDGRDSELSSTQTLAGYSVLSISAGDLLEENDLDGYLHVTSLDGPGLVGFAQVDIPVSGTAGAGVADSIPPRSLLGLNAVTPGSGASLFSAQFAHAGGPSPFFTSLNLVNTSGAERNLTLFLTDDQGDPAGNPVELTLAPGVQYTSSAGSLLVEASSPQPESFIGSLRVETDGPGILGDVVFGDPEGLTYVAALPLQQEPFQEAIFGHVAVIPGTFFTGLAFFNPGEEPARITVEVHQTNGQVTGTAQFTLEHGGRTAQLVEQFVAAASNQIGGFIVVGASSPIVGQMLFGSLGGPSGIQLLSAVPPTILN